MYFRYFLIINNLPFEKGVVLHLNKLESPSPKDALCQDRLKLIQWLWRRLMYFYYFVIIPLGKGCDPSFEQTGITFTQGSFVSSLKVIGPVVLDKKMKL